MAEPIPAPKLFFDISLAEFSLAGPLYAGKLTNLEFPAMAKRDFGISNVEYVSGFWQDKAKDQAYLNELKQRTDDLGVRNVLIMVDGEGDLGSPNATERKKAVENHYKWVEAAKFLGCHAIRVNLNGKGSDEEIAKAGVEGYGALVDYGAKHKMAVIIENHFGPSTNPDWLADVVRQVNSPYAGVLPDFGNFTRRTDPEAQTIEAFAKTKVIKEYDRYDGVKKLMPYAKGVSAKTHQFDDRGYDVETDFTRMLKLIKDAGFKGFIGIEYEGAFLKQMMQLPGDYLTEFEGIMATKRLLEKVGATLS
ncbi:Sugar phosphate isomerase/epimerase [Catalinimonas alkaloidigena]|uniref:Sugar phosphate isomerase/epimerase n=2 Tax=Catalinimonas alkaloidigena TaxID=1075417 RepID=A0A1G9BM22_9BACT|nr:sugar phosphate isomerase/epimerase family protein [Catalinimonas alkaloidigena]SDK40290.1 Sugar phosphate isomerase/epimerase [Catalinimonas alkaloidigena]